MNELDMNKSYIVTGCAGFVGFHLSQYLLERGCVVVGIDNMNDYYAVSLKESRLHILQGMKGFTFHRMDIADHEEVMNLFEKSRPDIVIHLAAQAGVRYSIDCPQYYIQSNIVGFFNILEACRKYPVQHLVYASSSSVYGDSIKTPFSETDQVDKPVSLYAATKKSNELMAYSYGKLYGIPLTGLRFFTVYGPYGRPDMAYFKFADKMMRGEEIQIYNNGEMYRDFTYVDDVVAGIANIIPNPPAADDSGVRYKIYNIGNNHPERLMDMIGYLEAALGISAVKTYLPMQPGDVYQTYADVSSLMQDFNYRPDTPLEEGLSRFAEWYLDYYRGREEEQS